MSDDIQLPSARRSDGTQPDLPNLPNAPARPAGPAPAPRPPAPTTSAARGQRPPVAPEKRSEPVPSVLAVIREKLRVRFGIREDDPIFAFIEVLAEFEKGMWRTNEGLNQSIQEKLEILNKNFNAYKEAFGDAQPAVESVQQLNVEMVEFSQKFEMLADHVDGVKKLSEQITQTGYMDRMIKIMAPAIGCLGGVVIGFLLAAAVFLLK